MSLSQPARLELALLDPQSTSRSYGALAFGTLEGHEPEAGRKRLELRADERARTVDLLHGKQTLYQLSYIREGAEYSRDYEPSFPRRSGTTSSGSG